MLSYIYKVSSDLEETDGEYFDDKHNNALKVIEQINNKLKTRSVKCKCQKCQKLVSKVSVKNVKSKCKKFKKLVSKVSIKSAKL